MSAKPRCPRCQHPRGPRRGRRRPCQCACHAPRRLGRAERLELLLAAGPKRNEQCAECSRWATRYVAVSELPGGPAWAYPLCGFCGREVRDVA